MEKKEKVTISDGSKEIEIALVVDDDREVAMLLIDWGLYHFERIRKEMLLTDYRVDADPDYQPQSDSDGYCYILAPFCE